MKVNSRYLLSYIESVGAASKNTARSYLGWLKSLETFAHDVYQSDLDVIIKDAKDGKLDVYDFLSKYCSYLGNNGKNLSANTIREKVSTARDLLEFSDVEISPRKFKLKVRLPKKVRRQKKALSRDDIRRVLVSCSEARLKAYVLFLAATGMRAVEALSIRLGDVDFDSRPAVVHVRGEYTKTRQDRYTYLTDECTKHLQDWLTYKYRERRIVSYDKKTGKPVSRYDQPKRERGDLLFAVHNKNATPRGLYFDVARQFGEMLDRVGWDGREQHDRRREITLHSLRRFVKTTISNLGYQDFSEWFIGHSGSTYWRETEQKKVEIFRKVEPYLTFLDVTSLEAKGSDQQTRIDQLQADLQKEREERARLYEQLYSAGIIRKP